MPVTACGLANVGETCYLNTLLQCLRACDGFRELVQLTKESTKTPLTTGLKMLFELMAQHAGTGVVSPRGFIHEVSKAFPFLNVRSQNDVHEMFMLLIARMAEELGKKTTIKYLNQTKSIPPMIKAAYDHLSRKCDNAWTTAFSNEYSPLTDLIHGQLLTQIVCGHCNYIHHNYQPFSVWEVQMIQHQNGENLTLEECFLASLEQDTLHDWKCSKCMTTTTSQKIVKLWRLPRILVVCLKRFKQGSRGNLKKITTDVDIPSDIKLFPMNLGPNNIGVSYSLRSSAIHNGDIQFGHYHALVNTPNSWMVVNDGLVMTLSNFKLGIKDGYMLFYELSE
jgi:ubiquitin C-terminal hydrolase